MSWLALVSAARAHWKLIGLGLLVMALAAQSVRLGHRTNQLERERVNNRELRADRNTLIAAAKEAERLNQEQVARIEKEQQEVTNDIEAKYEADLARLRAELGKRLRSPAPPRNPGSPEAGPNGEAPGKPDEAARVCIPTGDYVRGAETELQLDTLITWIEEQLKVRR